MGLDKQELEKLMENITTRDKFKRMVNETLHKQRMREYLFTKMSVEDMVKMFERYYPEYCCWLN